MSLFELGGVMGKMNANEYFESMGMNKVSAEHAVEAVRFHSLGRGNLSYTAVCYGHIPTELVARILLLFVSG